VNSIARKESATNESVAAHLAAAFRRHGVEIVFGQSIPSAFHIAAPDFGIRQAAYRTENAGGAMADGYARIGNRVGVVTAQNGPAATLLVAPLAEAYKASVPVVALVQEVPRAKAGRNAFQELDHARLFDACAKWVGSVDQASRVDDFVDQAFTAAASGRPGPAVLLVPADLLTETMTDAEARTANLGAFPLDRPVADPARVREAAQWLVEARSPLVIAGGGVHLSQACSELAALQEECHLPVATTTMGKGTVSETHPLSLGVVGYFMGVGGRTRDMRPMVDRADVILLVGNRTNENGTDSWSLYPRGARYIHIDVDGSEIGRNYEALRLLGDAKLTLEALRSAMLKAGVKGRRTARAGVEAAIQRAVEDWRKLTHGIRTSDRNPIRPERIMAELDGRLSAGTVVVADASYSSIWVSNYLTAKEPGMRFLTPRGLAGVGWGLPMAIGAKLAAPDRKVVCVAGDGAFGHCWAELETAKRLKLDVLVVVLSNQILGYQKDAEERFFGAHSSACYFEPIDHAAIARACGCDGIRIERASDLAAHLERALGSGTPTVLDVVIDPTARPPITSFDGHFPSPF
jgi:acetolactate synthase-1/2/3 large subunit